MKKTAAIPVVACLALAALGVLGLGLSPAALPSNRPQAPGTVTPDRQDDLYLPLVAGGFPPTGTLSGMVQDVNGPVAGATVRVKATTNATRSAPDGRFTLTALQPRSPVTITAWAPGYFIGGGDAFLPGADDIQLTLVAHNTVDYADYEWLSAYTAAGQEGNCQNCHADADDSASKLPFDEWALDAHAGAAQNQRFLTMYNGTDVYGNQSPLTRYVCSRDYGCFPLRPDPTQPYYGPGYKLDFPETAGNCATCHTPAAAMDDPYSVDPNTASGVGAEGVACDFCHKVWDVRLDAATGSPYANMPGVLSFEFRRPPPGHQFFAGPFDDVAPGEDTYSPLQNESQFCAPCHFGLFWGTEIYNSFGEWLASPYSDRQTGKSCQDCHMPPSGATRFARPDQGGVIRDPMSIFSHRMPGASDEELLRNAVTMTATARLDDNKVVVTVSIINDQTGHHVPTDSPLRHLILLVRPTDANGAWLNQLGGPTVPTWCGTGDPAQGHYAGLPGNAYAKILQEMWTEISPTGAYWNQTRVLSDNRLAAFATDASSYAFAAPEQGEVSVEVSLIFRRAFIELANQKGWDVRDIVMEQERIVLDP